MPISELDLSLLEDCTSTERWGANTPRDRKLYRDTRFWYKLWGPDFLRSSPYVVGSKFIKLGPLAKKPQGFDVGLYTQETAAAFVEFISDEGGTVLGYVTKRGDHSKVVTDDFILKVFEACRTSGWLYSDFCFNNVISVDGQLSLIDFDTHLSKMDCLDLEFEREKGGLRPHVFPGFRDLVEAYIGI